MKAESWIAIAATTAATAMAIYLLSSQYLFAFIGLFVSRSIAQNLAVTGIVIYGFGLFLPVLAWRAVFSGKTFTAVGLSGLGILTGLGVIAFYNMYMAGA